MVGLLLGFPGVLVFEDVGLEVGLEDFETSSVGKLALSETRSMA